MLKFQPPCQCLSQTLAQGVLETGPVCRSRVGFFTQSSLAVLFTTYLFEAVWAVFDSAVAASAQSCWTNDRDSNELKYLQEALCLVDSLLCLEGRDDFKRALAENSPSP